MSTTLAPHDTHKPENTETENSKSKSSPTGSIISDLLVAACVIGGAYLAVTGAGVISYKLYGAAPSMIAMHCLLALGLLLYFNARPTMSNGITPTMTSSELADHKTSVGFSIAIFCVAIPIAVLGYNSMRNARYEEYTTSTVVMMVIASCLAAPIAEELLWRKFTYVMLHHRALQSQYPAVLAYCALIATPVVFGLSHNNAFQALMVLPLSFMLTALYIVTKNVKLTIAIHILYNASYVLITPMLRSTFVSLDATAAQGIWLTGMAIAIVCVVYVIATLAPGILRDITTFGTLPKPQPEPHTAV